MKKAAVLLLAIAILFTASNAFAASPWTTQTSYQEKVLHKLDFGVKNVLGGWTEIFRSPIKYHKDGKSVSEGALRGIGNALIDTAGGALHLVTFLIPQIDVPLPNNGVMFS